MGTHCLPSTFRRYSVLAESKCCFIRLLIAKKDPPLLTEHFVVENETRVTLGGWCKFAVNMT